MRVATPKLIFTMDILPTGELLFFRIAGCFGVGLSC